MTRPSISWFLILIFFLLADYNSVCQSNDSLFRVDIWYSNGQADFKLKGIKSTEEFISFKKEGDRFVISKYYVVQKLTAHNKLVSSDTTYSVSDKIVRKETMGQLFASLNQDKNNADEKSLKAMLGPITDKQIKDVAKEFKLDWTFNEKYSSNADRRALERNIKSHKFFNEYFERIKPYYKVDTAFTFANQTIGLTITTYTKNDTSQYFGHTASLIFQPFCKVLDSNRTKLNCIINVDINNYLNRILPYNSIFKKVLQTRLGKYYIRWSLENVDMWE